MMSKSVPVEEAYLRAIARATAAVAGLPPRMAQEQVARLGRRLAAQPPRRRALLLRCAPRYRAPEVSEWLARHALDACRTGDRRALRVATAAAEVAEALTGLPLPELAGDLRAEAWAAVAEAHCCAGDLTAAQRALKVAVRWLYEGTGDPLVASRFARRCAACLAEAGEEGRAAQLLTAAGRLDVHLGQAGGEPAGPSPVQRRLRHDDRVQRRPPLGGAAAEDGARPGEAVLPPPARLQES